MSTPHGEQVRQMLAEAAANLLCQKPQPSDTPETDHQGFTVLRLGKDIQAVPADFARELERQRDALQSKLSTVYQWIERHHQDGFTDSLTYWQNLEKIGDKYGDRIDDAERQRDAAIHDIGYYKAKIDELNREIGMAKHTDLGYACITEERDAAREDARRLAQIHHDAYRAIEAGLSYWMDGGSEDRWTAIKCFRDAAAELKNTWSSKQALAAHEALTAKN